MISEWAVVSKDEPDSRSVDGINKGDVAAGAS